MDSLRQKFEEWEEKEKWVEEFNKLKNQTSSVKPNQLKEARRPDNFRKNRYRDVLPFDHTRIRLGCGTDNDYINASLVEIPGTGREHILTQGPLPSTSRDFWQMVWEQNSKAVIMLNRVIEKNTIKCHQYFPEKEGDNLPDPMRFDEKSPAFEVTLAEENITEHFVVRKLDLHNVELDEHREVIHYQFVTWPDFGVPESSSDFLEFLQKVRSDGYLNRNVFGPPIIHCSAGIGRSGTFVVVDAALVIAKTKGVQSVDIMKMVKELRKSRMGLIQTPDQLRFCWLTVLDALEKEEWTDLLNTGLYASNKADFLASSNEPKTLKRPSVSTEAEEPTVATPSGGEKENQPVGAAPPVPPEGSPNKKRKNSGGDVAPSLVNEAQLIDQINNGSLEFSPNPPSGDVQGDIDCSSDTSDSLELACPSSRSATPDDNNAEEMKSPPLEPVKLGGVLAEEIPFADQLPRSLEERRRKKEEQKKEMQLRLSLLKAKMKYSDESANRSVWAYYIGGALLALGIAGLYGLYTMRN